MRRGYFVFCWIAILGLTLAFLNTSILWAQTGRARGSSPFTEVNWEGYTFKFMPGNQMAQVFDAGGHGVGTILSQNGTLTVLPTVTGAAADDLKRSFQAWKDQGGEKALASGSTAPPARSRQATSSQTAAPSTAPSAPASSAQADGPKPVSPPVSAASTGAQGMVVGGATLGTLENPETAELVKNNLTLLLDMQLLRLQPALLEDAEVMKYFVLVNNCRYNPDPQIARLVRNEFDYAKAVEYYKSKAAELLATLPHTTRATLDTPVMGEYNTAKQAFPLVSIGRRDLPRGVKVTQQEPVPLPNMIAAGGHQICGDAFYARNTMTNSGRLPRFYVFDMEKTMTFTEVPMDMEAARKYVEATPGTRQVRFEADISLADTPTPAIKRGCGNTGQVCADFAATVTKVTVVKPGLHPTIGKSTPDQVLAVVYP